MSTLESIFWNILGYSAMPFIFIIGFITYIKVVLLFDNLVDVAHLFNSDI